VKGYGGKQLVDVIALVMQALDPDVPLTPVEWTAQERAVLDEPNAWLAA
jgi:hypothetical protein